jgi:hypothetical protein
MSSYAMTTHRTHYLAINAEDNKENNATQTKNQSNPESKFYEDEDIVNTIKHLFQTLIPMNILCTTKKYLCSKCCKPIDMKVHNFSTT